MCGSHSYKCPYPWTKCSCRVLKKTFLYKEVDFRKHNIKTWKSRPNFKSFNPCSSVGRDDRKQFECLKIVLNDKTGQTKLVGINVMRGHVFAFKKKANSSFKNNETKIAPVLWCCRRYGQHYCCHTQDCKQRKIYKNDNEALCKWKRFPSCRAKE